MHGVHKRQAERPVTYKATEGKILEGNDNFSWNWY